MKLYVSNRLHEKTASLAEDSRFSLTYLVFEEKKN